MQKNETAKFGAVLADVYALYGKECPEGVRRIWWEALKHYELADVTSALSRHVRNGDGGQFIPKPADVVRAIEGSGDSRALQAWTKVERAVRDIGPWESAVFDDARIHAVLTDMGGWMGFGQITDDEWPFKRNEFMKRYQGYLINPPKTVEKRLIGFMEAHNAKGNFPVPLPRLVGDPERARLVYESGQAVKRSYPRLARDYPIKLEGPRE